MNVFISSSILNFAVTRCFWNQACDKIQDEEFNRRSIDPVGLEAATPFHVVFFLMIRVEDYPAWMLPFHSLELGLIEAISTDQSWG